MARQDVNAHQAAKADSRISWQAGGMQAKRRRSNHRSGESYRKAEEDRSWNLCGKGGVETSLRLVASRGRDAEIINVGRKWRKLAKAWRKYN